MIEEILDLIENSPSYRKLLEIASQGRSSLEVSGLCGCARSFLLYSWFRRFPGKYLVITKTEKEAYAIKNDLNEISNDSVACHFPEWQINPYQWKTPPPEDIAGRLETLYQIQNQENLVVTASVRAILEPTIAPDKLAKSSFAVKLNQEVSLDLLNARLLELGYERAPMVEEIGNFSIRGGIIDIFPHSTENPVRIELFGDFVDSLRYFSVSTQRSIQNIETLTLLPRREVMLSNQELDHLIKDLPEKDRKILEDRFSFGIDNPGLEWATGYFRWPRSYLFDYLDRDTVTYLIEPKLIKAEIEGLLEMFVNLHGQEQGKYEALPSPDKIYMPLDDFERRVEDLSKISEVSFEAQSATLVSFGMGDHPTINSQMKLLREQIQSRHQKGQTVFLACDNQVQKERLEDILAEDASAVDISVLDVSEGFSFPEAAFELLTDHQVFTRSFHRYRRTRIKEGIAISSYTNLNVGDYVVHIDYGIGKYKGLEELTIDSRRRDCLLILYEKDDRLYVPIEEFNRVQKYIGKEGHPRLSSLSGPGWQKIKARTKKAIAEMAEELLKLYAERKAHPGFKFSPDSTWTRQLEASFPYDETPDQLQAILDIKKDMEADYPMDRLICGDVGFGKTEVAIRAAFKAVCDEKQVAILVPTTILAQQHQNTFGERLKDYPVRIEMLSRFKTRAEQKEIVEDLKNGKVDIIIGTHRLLSKDVHFRDLGLLIIDEEQRFGVADKEKIKKIKRLIDVLTLTATPIPRTMQMSMLGARDMSVINTSPKDRFPIYTEISEFHPEIIRQAILKEIERGGQVYFVHNRVQTIMSIYRYLSKLMPEIRIAVGHGQMPEKELEEVMLGFLSRHYDVLLSTSIIESGLDIPLVNTIIINRADRFGLAQLYQLRGRVGRSPRRALSVLLVPPLRILTTQARKRLKALEQHTELGSGFHLALKDLEIRGAGNLLGSQQHGFIEEVGFDLYLRLLKEAVDELKGIKPKPEQRVKLDLDLELYLPDDYVAFSQQKVELYQKLAQADSYEALNEIKLEVIDRFGPLPLPAENLFGMAEIKLLANRIGLAKFIFKNGFLKLVYPVQITPQKKQVENLARQVSHPMEFDAAEQFAIIIDFRSDHENDWVQKFKFVLQLLE